MTFLPLDDKTECFGFYHNRKLFFGQEIPKELGPTWKYLPILENIDTVFASLYVDGKDFTEVCPEVLKEQWEQLNKQAKAFVRSFVEAKVSLRENCFYDLVPQKFLIEYCEIKCKIIDHIINTYPKPQDYEHRVGLEKILTKIRSQKLIFDEEYIKNNLHNNKIKDFSSTYLQKDCYINYNQFHSKTGRLTTAENSFPILNISRSLRGLIKPDNDFFIDIDYNAAELRVFLALAGFTQPTEDIHEWNMNKFGYFDRNTAKNEFISWLYGKKNEKEEQFRQYYDTELIKKKYWKNNKVINYYGRNIESDEFHSINYIVQSSTADMVLRQVVKVDSILKNTRSKIKMIIHDNIVLDMCKEDKHLVRQIVSTYNNTDFGKFVSSVKIGKSLNEMRKIL